jgi:hypothetical protein
MANGTIDPEEIVTPEILDPRQLKGCIPVCSRNILELPSGLSMMASYPPLTVPCSLYVCCSVRLRLA